MEEKDIITRIVNGLREKIADKKEEIIRQKERLEELELELRLLEEDLEN